MIETRCMECGTIIRGRSDKKFCCDMCRNIWHNRDYREKRLLMSGVNNRLAANRRILEHIYNSGLRKVSRNVLEEERFDFSHYTSVNTNPLGKKTYRCYEFTYSTDLRNYVSIEKD